MTTLFEAAKNGFPMWVRSKWTGGFWLNISTMEILTWDKSNKMDPKIVLATHNLTEEDILADDWHILPIGG